ncbi:hypothetical protein C0992_003404 [Termitomyces sp. T32_za158]|nr:hypothetical protein C0992_003404 [Termitomyces sp. T32_za158]
MVPGKWAETWTASLRSLRWDPGVTRWCVKPVERTTKDARLHGCGRKTGKGAQPQVVEGVLTPVGTPHLRPDKGKRKAVSESKVPRRMRQWLSLALPAFEGGPLGSNVFSPGPGRLLPSITICQGPPEILWAEVRRLQKEVKGLQEDVQVARQECDEATQVRDTLLRDCNGSFELRKVQVEEIEQLWARLMREAAGSLTGIPGFMASSAQEVEELAQGLRQANKSKSHWHEWLLCKVTGARLETLGWAQEHRLLLYSLSLGVSYVVEELGGQAMTLRVAQGAGCLSRLMEAHRHRSFVEMGAWLEAFVDGFRTLLLLEEIVQVARELLEAEFGPGGDQEESQEG